jgi:hypothetical protein
MAYRVCVSEGFIRPLPPLIRGCIRSELEWVAQMAEKNAAAEHGRRKDSDSLAVRPLPNGYWMSYQRDDRARTVRLMVVAQPKNSTAAH